MIIAEVIPITSSILTNSLSYFSSEKIIPGTLVIIPLRRQEIKGIVISTSTVKDIKQSIRNQNFKIRNIIKVYSENIFSNEYLQTIYKLRNYYLISAGKLINITYPKHIIDNFDKFIRKSSIKSKSESNTFSKQLIQESYKERINIYKHFVEKELNEGKSVHIICPTVLLVKKITYDLEKYFNNKIYSLHGKISNKKITEYYKKLQMNHSLIISTPNFIDIQSKNRATIFIDNDSSIYYRQKNSPYIDMRVFIEEYAKNAKLSLVIADSILRTIRFNNNKKVLKNIANDNINMEVFSPKKISLVNYKEEIKTKQTDQERIKSLLFNKEFSPFSKKLIEKIKKSIKDNERIFFYTQRKGLAPNIICRDCGKLVQDITTGFPYSLYIKKNTKNLNKKYFFINSITGNIIPAFDTCQFCGSWKLQTLGVGTETIQKELEKIFPKLKNQIYIIDSTHAPKQKELHKIINIFNEENKNPRILIGTQKALPYLKNIDTAYIIAIDGIFYKPSYTSEDRALIIIKQIYEESCKTFIQTRISNKEDKIIIKTKKDIQDDNYDKLQLKFSKRLKNVFDKIRYSPEIQKQMTSKYTESLNIWRLIRTGNYKDYIMKTKKNIENINVVIKINHTCKKDDYTNLVKTYEEKFKKYNFLIKRKSNIKKYFVTLSMVIFIDEKLWNIEYQETELYQKLPLNERGIDIIINPDILI